MPELKLTVGIPVSVNHYLAYRAIIKNGKPMAMSYKTKEALEYQKWLIGYLKDETKKQNWTLTPDKVRHFYVDAYFYFPRIDMDANNYWKILLDAITDSGLIWLPPGIFDDMSQLERFESRCIVCKRYKRNCSLLAGAKAGRVSDDIVNGKCMVGK